MKRFLLALGLILLVAQPVSAAEQKDANGQPKAVKTTPLRGSMGIAAVVNNDIITSNEVDGRYYMSLHGAPNEPAEEIKKQLRTQALDSLIDEQIRLQEAQRLDVMPEEGEVDEAFAKLSAQNKMTPEAFKKILQARPGQYESLRRQIRTQIAWGNVVRKKIRSQVNVTENDINNYLAEKEKNPAKTEYQIAEIFLKNSDENMQLAQKLVADMRAGKQKFSLIARQFSTGLEASKGGLLGWIPENRLEPVLDEAVKNTPVGQITDPVLSPRGIHIFLVREKRDILAASENSMRLSIKQLMVPVPAGVPADIEAKAMAQAQFFKSQAKDCKSADEAIAKINHPGSRDMGEVRLGDLPAPIMNVVRDLPLEQASEPVRSREGIIVYIVCNRTETGEEIVRDDVANAIGTERLNRLQYRYYRDLRAGAYVDIK